MFSFLRRLWIAPMISPTGLGLRKEDEWGKGHYGAPRPHGFHKGMDFICVPGHIVRMPINGRIVRKAKPYPDSFLSGVVIRNKDMEIKLFYFKPDNELIGKNVKQGENIGIAQDIRERYDDRMIPHLHLQIDSLNPAMFL